MHFHVVAIPLNRPQIVDFLLPPQPRPRGTFLFIVGQRPTPAAEASWVEGLARTPQPAVRDLLLIDHPQNHLHPTWSDRLVPRPFLEEAGFLTRNLGGWAAIYFGVVGGEEGQERLWQQDPLLQRAQLLKSYGSSIHAFAADPDQVEKRLRSEVGLDPAGTAAALEQLQTQRGQAGLTRQTTVAALSAYIGQLYADLVGDSAPPAKQQPPLPRLLLLDELLGQMVRLEQARRAALAAEQWAEAEEIAGWQERWTEQTGLRLILKGEYIVGRHRRSTVLIAPELGVVVKQPAPEPFHEIHLGANEVNGRLENWPNLTEDGALVTPRGRIRLTLEEDLLPRLGRALGHEVRFSTLFGLAVETFVGDQTVQEAVLADPAFLSPRIYEQFVLHQQLCELLGGENGDWHSANFVLGDHQGTLVHVDWGAARALRPEEHTPQGAQQRLDQVQNIAFSFHDEALAQRTLQLHQELVQDEERIARVQARARALLA